MTTATLVAEEIACGYCQKHRAAKPDKSGGLKLPLGWKREKGSPVCRDCWKSRYLLRALTFPVASPVSGTWKELEADLKVMWSQTTAASNWMMTQCYVRDARRDDSLAKLPPMPRIYLYPEARVLFPGLAPQSIAALEQAVQRKYRAKRYDVIWTCAASLPSMRYPQPYPIHNQSWEFYFEDQRPHVALRIGPARWTLRLKSGPRYRRQIEGMRRMAERGELAIYKANDGTIMIKLVGWLTRSGEAVRGGATLFVRTGKDHLLSALDVKDERIWIENCDHLPRLIACHGQRLQRLSEDQKAEQRPVPSFAESRRTAVQKQRNRMDTAIKEVAAHLAGFAARRKFAKVIYDDSQRWLNPFPYFQLEGRIRTVLDERGILFEKAAASGPVMEESREPLAKE